MRRAAQLKTLCIIGRANITNLSLQRIEADRFSVARLLGKLANICPDLPASTLTSTSAFKALTGGDTITGEFKHLNSFEFEPFARLIFSANPLPKSQDASQAFFRRWIVIPFSRSFAESGSRQKELDRALGDPAELSGLLNVALEHLPSLQQTGFGEPETVRSAGEEFRQLTDPLAVWLDAETVMTSNAFISCADLLSAYNRHAGRTGQPPYTKQAFGRAIDRVRPQVRTLQRTYKGMPDVWCYIGIGLKAHDRPDN